MSSEEDSSSSATSVKSGKQSSSKRKDGYEETLKDKINRSRMQYHPSVNDYDDYDDEEDSRMYYSDFEDTDLNEQPKRPRTLGPMELLLKCEWKNCSYETKEDSKFHVHVSYHIPDLEIKTLATGEEVYKCLWAECNYLTGGVKEIQRHVTYHSYHTKLKHVGAFVIKEWSLPRCMYGSETRNLVPDKIDPMVCEWKDCNKEFNNVQVFLYHTQMHVNENFMEPGAKRENLRCKWDGCTSKPSLTRLALTNHIRTHTQEKVVGCPVCGHLFASNTKLLDHCERQLPHELLEFQCSHCYKQFPSIRLLKDHMRGHINFYKCCYCDMTCTSRQTFSAHIRYKHLDSRPFMCNLCDYACKTHFDLKLHLTSHDPKPQFECEEFGCDFTCRTKRTLQRHMIDDHHVSNSPVYCCHLPECSSKYKRGCYLTKHLMTKHCLRWPSGHSKFMYHRQADGTYRLQTVRYESMKLCGKNELPALPTKSNFKVTRQPGEGTRSFRVSPVESDSDSKTSEVLISIEDESGNTIDCCTAPEVVGDKIPKDATVIASATSEKCLASGSISPEVASDKIRKDATVIANATSEKSPLSGSTSPEVVSDKIRKDATVIASAASENSPLNGSTSPEVVSDKIRKDETVIASAASENSPVSRSISPEVVSDKIRKDATVIASAPSENSPLSGSTSPEVVSDKILKDATVIASAASENSPLSGSTSPEVVSDKIRKDEIVITSAISGNSPISGSISTEVVSDEIPKDASTSSEV